MKPDMVFGWNTDPVLGIRGSATESWPSEKLASASRLLITPTSETVYEAAVLLEEVQTYLTQLKDSAQAEEVPSDVRDVQIHLQRVRDLAEGALRVQWTKMRTVMALTQTYAPGGQVFQWRPSRSKLDIKA
jgi:hypothetical protein